MSETRDDEELLREALLELSLLRDRESEALMQSNALLDGLARLSQAATPAEGLTDLLRSARQSLNCSTVVVLTEASKGARVAQTTDPTFAGQIFPSELVTSRKPRRVADLAMVAWWPGAPAEAGTVASLVSTPIELPGRPKAALVCLGEARAQFTRADQTLITRLAGLASQALSAHAMAERNALLAAVIDGASASVSIADARRDDMPLIYVNESFLTISGYARGEILGANCRFLTAEPPDSPERERLRQTVAARGSGTFELRNRRKDGSIFWNRLTLYPVPGASGTPDFMVATQVNISAEKAAAEERDMARNRLIGALSSTSEGFLLLDPSGDVVFANAQYRDFFETEHALWQEGSSFVENWTHRLTDLKVPKGNAKRIARERRDALYSGGRGREERLPDGRFLLINDHPTADGGAVSIATDITSLKATERVLAQRAVAIDAAQDGIAVTDEDGRFVYMNPSHLAMFGYQSEAEILGRHWSTLYRADQAEYIERVGLPELKRTGTWRSEIAGVSKTGEPVKQEVSLSLLKDVGLVCVTRDVSERIKSESERARLREQVQAAQRQEAIGQLAAGVAHDFNNLLSVVTGSAAVLEIDLGEEHPARVHVDRIAAAGERAAELVSRLLDLGARRPEIRRIDLRERFAEAADLLRSGIPSRIAVSASAPSEPLMAEADATAFLQVALNLGINARDAIGEVAGEIGISLDEVVIDDVPDALRVGSLKPGRSYARLRVTDTGAGMSREEIEQIFAPYFSTKGAAGTGLGLAVVSSVAKTAGGAVRVVSRPDFGSTFEVFWPIEAIKGRATEALSIRSTGPSRAPKDAEQVLAGAAILVCDDAEPVAQVIAAALEQAGAETAICEDPRDALEAVREDPLGWNLIVTDYDMPEMSGAALAAAVREIAPELPIVLCTALERRIEGDENFDVALMKPIEPEHLINVAAAAIRRGSESSEQRDEGVVMRILIADDHELVRDSIAAFLEREGDLEITLAEDFQSAASLIEAQGPFDLVLLDYSMPGMSGLEGLEKAKSMNAGRPVGLLSGTADRAVARAALDSGAAGFLPKSMPAKSMINAVRFMIAGDQYAPVKFMTEAEETETHPLAERLSDRELQVLNGLCQGLSNKEIALELDLREVTIKLHVKTLCRKLEARNRTHAAMIAKEEGLF